MRVFLLVAFCPDAAAAVIFERVIGGVFDAFSSALSSFVALDSFRFDPIRGLRRFAGPVRLISGRPVNYTPTTKIQPRLR